MFLCLPSLLTFTFFLSPFLSFFFRSYILVQPLYLHIRASYLLSNSLPAKHRGSCKVYVEVGVMLQYQSQTCRTQILFSSRRARHLNDWRRKLPLLAPPHCVSPRIARALPGHLASASHPKT